MRVVGLDLSLTATGLYFDGGGVVIAPKTKGMRRLHDISEDVMATVIDFRADVIVVEGYAFGRPQQACHLGELGGVIRMALWERDIAYVDVPPAVLKKYATGKGNAGKAEVMAAAIRRLSYDGHDDNVSDSLWLYQFGLAAYDDPRAVPMPAAHRVALAGVSWPKLSLPDGNLEPAAL